MDKNIEVADKRTQSFTRSLNDSECLGKPDSLAPLAPKESKRTRQIVCCVFMTWATGWRIGEQSVRLLIWGLESIYGLIMFIGISLRMRITLRLLFGYSSCKLLLNRFTKLLAVTPQRRMHQVSARALQLHRTGF